MANATEFAAESVACLSEFVSCLKSLMASISLTNDLESSGSLYGCWDKFSYRDS